jgi:hypothetical protein
MISFLFNIFADWSYTMTFPVGAFIEWRHLEWFSIPDRKTSLARALVLIDNFPNGKQRRP